MKRQNIRLRGDDQDTERNRGTEEDNCISGENEESSAKSSGSSLFAATVVCTAFFPDAAHAGDKCEDRAKK